MKKAISLLLILASVLALTGCGIDEPTATAPAQTTAPTEPTVCEHTPEVIRTVPASCTEAGCVISSCSQCGEEFSEEIPTLGHSFTAASCTAAPSCTLCGEITGSALGHVYNSGVCIHCGDELPQDIPGDCQHDYALSHQTPPTCTQNGSMEYRCDKCAHIYTQSIAATGHRFSAAACTAPETCSICQQTRGEALGHAYQDGKCTRCGGADPSAPTEVTYTVTIRSDKGKAVQGVTVSIYTTADIPAAVGITNDKGVVSLPLLSAESYRIVLSDIPSGLATKDSYTFRSTRVNINLSTVSVITPTDHSQANYKAGSTMGDFTLTDTDGNTYNLSQLLKEKDLVILNFWFVNCGPCKAEFPYFEAINQKYDNVQLLAMNHLDSEGDIVALRQQMGVTFPMIAENIGFQQGFNLYAYPTTVFIAPSGKILKIQVGEFKTQAELENLINSFIN